MESPKNDFLAIHSLNTYLLTACSGLNPHVYLWTRPLSFLFLWDSYASVEALSPDLLLSLPVSWSWFHQQCSAAPQCFRAKIRPLPISSPWPHVIPKSQHHHVLWKPLTQITLCPVADSELKEVWERRKGKVTSHTKIYHQLTVTAEDVEGCSWTPGRCLHLEALEKLWRGQ